jgi:cytochrome c oxidase assembly protein subunit 17
MQNQESVPKTDCSNAKVSKTTGKKICCVCKPTKQIRDECIVLNGEDMCKAFIDAHNQCLRDEGFEVL